MPELSRPTVRVADSFVAAMTEFMTEGRGGPDDNSMIGGEIRQWQRRWDSPGGFAAFAAALAAQSDEATARPADSVPSTTWWWVDGRVYLGRIAVRHRLNDRLQQIGGHIGYDVRPSARHLGHATAMLRAVLPLAYRMGIDPALLTCGTGNVASRKVIQANGGVLEDERHGTLRFWVSTQQAQPGLQLPPNR